MTIVVDASVAMKWVLPEDGSAEADALLEQTLIAPSFWLVECANALWRNVAIKKIGSDEATYLLQKLMRAPVASAGDDHELVLRAMQLGIELTHPIYDCLYLALALHEDTYVVTADRRFAGRVAKNPALANRVRLWTPNGEST